MANAFPLFLYVYGADGMHGEPISIAGPPGLQILMALEVRKAIEEKREVRITDTDDFLVFHAYKGHIKWDGMKAHVCSECQQIDDPKV